MTEPPYSDRLKEEYVDSEPVSFGFSRGSEVEWSLDIPVEAFNRMTDLGNAYDLHVLRNTDYWGELGDEVGASLGRGQCEEFAVELGFIRSIVNDPVIDRYAAQLSHLAVQVARSPFTDAALKLVGP